MTLPKLESLGSYEEVNGGAHRKAASIVGVPSLVRHLGFWNTGFSVPVRMAAGPSRHGAGSGAAGRPPMTRSEGLSDEFRQETYRRFVENLRAVITDRDRPTLEPDRKGFISELGAQIDSGTVTLVRFWWQTMRTTIRLEYHTEFITVTSIIDLSVKKRPKERVGRPGQASSGIVENLTELNGLFQNCPKDQVERYDALSHSLQISVWEAFEGEVLDAKIDEAPILGASLGEVFLDSRGMVIGSCEPGDEETKRQKALALTPPQVLRQPFQHELPRRRSRSMIEHRAPGSKWARGMLQRIWLFVEAEPHFGECEFTVTGFLEGRVLFITALGPQSAEAKGDGKPIPIRYFLHAFTDDEWQLGRLVDRINTLGTLRLAATMEIGALKTAGGLVERLAQEIESAGNIVQKAIQQSKAGPAANPDEGRDSVQRADEKIQEINNLYQLLNDEVSGDIRHRLERAKYYIERFSSDAVDLREKRVEGFQMYSEFVARRMSSIFGYVRFLETRMENLDAGNSSVARQYSSLKITSVTCGIDGLVSSLRDQTQEAQNQSKEIEKIQEFGEIALIGALLPYYLGLTFTHIFSLQGVAAEVVFVSVTLICSAVVVARALFKRKVPKAWARQKRVLGWFVAYLVAMGIAFAVLRHPWSPPAADAGRESTSQPLAQPKAPAHP